MGIYFFPRGSQIFLFFEKKGKTQVVIFFVRLDFLGFFFLQCGEIKDIFSRKLERFRGRERKRTSFVSVERQIIFYFRRRLTPSTFFFAPFFPLYSFFSCLFFLLHCARARNSNSLLRVLSTLKNTRFDKRKLKRRKQLFLNFFVSFPFSFSSPLNNAAWFHRL